jgi:hypothetical protein
LEVVEIFFLFRGGEIRKELNHKKNICIIFLYDGKLACNYIN